MLWAKFVSNNQVMMIEVHTTDRPRDDFGYLYSKIEFSLGNWMNDEWQQASIKIVNCSKIVFSLFLCTHCWFEAWFANYKTTGDLWTGQCQRRTIKARRLPRWHWNAVRSCNLPTQYQGSSKGYGFMRRVNVCIRAILIHGNLQASFENVKPMGYQNSVDFAL